MLRVHCKLLDKMCHCCLLCPQASMFQMAILLQFNDATQRTMTELMDATLLLKEVLQQVTQILVKNRLLV